MSKIIFFVVIVLAFVASRDDFPTWPHKFTMKFNETFTYPVIGTSNTTGSFYYDWENKRYAVYRTNGQRDRYCGLNGLYFFYNTPCTHYVEDGNRYLYYPEYNYCCNCCQNPHGCGVLTPDWMTGAEYIDEVTINGVVAFKWDKPGLQHNFYYESTEVEPENRVVLGIDQQPNDFQQFDIKSFSKTFNDSYTKPPAACSPSKTCSLFSICTAVKYF